MNLLITGAWKYSDEQLIRIKGLGWNVFDMENERGEMPCDYSEVDAVICNGLFLYQPIEKFTSLKYIQLTSAGLDRVPLDYISSNSIQIHNARGVYSIPMAETALSYALCYYRQNSFFLKNQEKHLWEKHRGLRELYRKTVCIVGCGSVGCECAKRFNAFDCTVLGVDKREVFPEGFREVYPMENLHDALSVSDIVVLSVALNRETEHLMDDKALSAMKDGSLLINISRGAVIDTDALISHANSGRIFFAIDVFENEPLEEGSPLWDNQCVVVTPHNSFVGDGNGERLWQVIIENLENFK